MNEPKFLKEIKNPKKVIDYDSLLRDGISLIQKFSGNKWTDYNFHDPGITILEQLCYALTDLGYRSNFKVEDLLLLNKDNFVCRALDNRIGGFMIAEVARLIKENKDKLPFCLYVTNSVQEEIGLRGAEMITNTLFPDNGHPSDEAHEQLIDWFVKMDQGTL